MNVMPRLADRAALTRLSRGTFVLIVVFWAVHLGMLTLRTAMRGSGDQFEIGFARVSMSLFGAGLCYLIYRSLRLLRQRSLAAQGMAGATLAFLAACLHAIVGTLTFEVLSPVPLLGNVAHYLYSAIWWFWFYFSWTTAFLALSFSITVQEQERHAAELAVKAQEAQVRALRYQINPHFLFNTLNAIAALVRDAPTKAEEMVVQLSDFFRRSLALNPMEDLTLAEEVDLQRLYLEIERTRFPDRLRFEVELGRGTADVKVPALLLQPLVENAVKHGVAKSETPTCITVRARLDGAALEILVENDARTNGHHAAGEKVGLQNVAERLRSRFGDDARIDCEELVQGGFRNRLRLPAHL
jgi:sensor histidine kinase YesM